MPTAKATLTRSAVPERNGTPVPFPYKGNGYAPGRSKAKP